MCARRTLISILSVTIVQSLFNVVLALHFKKESALFLYIQYAYVVYYLLCKVALSFQEIYGLCAQRRFLSATWGMKNPDVPTCLLTIFTFLFSGFHGNIIPRGSLTRLYQQTTSDLFPPEML